MGFWTEWLIKNNKKELHSKRDEELRQQQQKATTKLNYFYDQPSGHLEVNRKQNKNSDKGSFVHHVSSLTERSPKVNRLQKSVKH